MDKPGEGRVTNNPEYRPRRSCLYMPGANSRAIDKASSLDTDVVILDLEDAVSPELKESARDAVCVAVSEKRFGSREVVIRINSLDTPWGNSDMERAVQAGPDILLAPKVSTAADVEQLNAAIDAIDAFARISLWVMIETPLAVLNIAEIAAAAKHTRLAGFVLGTNDLAKDMRSHVTPDRASFQTALQLSVTAARAYGLVAIDGVFNDISDAKGLESECSQGRNLGFDGKTLIHPSQLEICNRVFSPTADEIAQARDVILAFEDEANAGKGVIKVNGKMTELLHLEEAKRLINIVEAIGGMAN